MQLLPPLTEDPKVAAREQAAGKHLPYARHVDDHTIETRDGLLMQVIQLRGLLFETADSDELNYRKRLRDAVLQSIGSSRFAIYHHIIRREAEVELQAGYPDSFSRRLDQAWKARLSGRKLYVNDLFLTLVRRPIQGRIGALDRLQKRFGRAVVSQPAAARFEFQALEQARDGLLAALASYEPRVLGVYETRQGPCSEPLEFLSYLLNGEMRPVLLPLQDLGDYLPYRRVSFGQDAVELGRAGASGRSFLGMVSIKDYPGQTAPGMLDELLRLPFEMTLSQSFGFVERQAALSRMNLALRRMKSAEDEAISLRGELGDA
jgi:type IV secretion system protein VirB4